MATINPLFGENLVIQLGNGASPEVFAAPAMINTSRGYTFSTTTESDELIDLANPSAPAQTVRRVKATDFKFDGAGMVHKADVAQWLKWVTEGTVKNVKVIDGINTISGPVILSSFQVTGERVKSSEFSCTIEQAGPMIVTPTV